MKNLESHQTAKLKPLKQEAVSQMCAQENKPNQICLEPSTMSYQKFVSKTQEALGKVEKAVSQEKVKESVKLLLS